MVSRSWIVAALLISGCGSAAADDDGPSDLGEEDDGAGQPHGDDGESDQSDDDDGRGSDDGPPSGTVSSLDCGLEGTQILGEAFETDEPLGASAAFAIEQLESDGAFVYFADRWGLQRTPHDGGVSENIVEDAWPFNDGMVVHGEDLIWTRNTEAGWELQSAAANGGETSMLTAFDGYTHWLRSDGTSVAWNGVVSGFPDESRIYVWSPGDAAATVLATGRYGWHADIDAGNVYATGYLPGTDPAAGAEVVFRLRVSDGSQTVVVEGFDDLRPADIVATSDDVVYVVADGIEPSGLQRVPKAGGEPVDVELGEAPAPDTLVSDANHVVGFTVGGEVWAFPTDGAPVHLTTTDNQLYPGHVVISGDSAFVVHHAHDCVQLEQKPDEHTGGTLEVCRRSVTRRCIEAIELR